MINNLRAELTKDNRYDYLLIFLLLLQIFGVLGDAFEPMRIFVILFAPFTINYFIKNNKAYRHYQYEIFVFVFWIFYACITLLWAIDRDTGLKDIFYLLINFMSILTIFFFAAKANNSHKSIFKGWIFLFLLSLPIALYEIFYDVHLKASAQESGELIGGIGVARQFASVTFGNYNSYNVIIIYILPFIFALLFFYKRTIPTILIWALLLSAFFILISNASRGAMICSVIFLVTFIFYAKDNKANKTGIIFFILALSITNDR